MAHQLKRFVFLGAPGVGKGTFASIIGPQLGLAIVGAGDLVREASKSDTPEGRLCREYSTTGQLVPDDLISELVTQRLQQAQEGWLLEGYPRTVKQARHLDAVAPPHRVINILLKESIAVKKILGRRVCRKCRSSFNVCDINEDGYVMPAIRPDFDACPYEDECPKSLASRDDDTADVIASRMKVYHEITEPLVQYYTKSGILMNFDVKKGVQDAPALKALMLS